MGVAADQAVSVWGTLVSWFQVVPESLMTLSIGVVAVLAGILGFWANEKRHKREYTLTLHMSFTRDDAMVDAHNLVERHFLDGDFVDVMDLSTEAATRFSVYMSHCESMAYAYRRKFIDQTTVDDMVSHRLCKAFAVGRDFIASRRQSSKTFFAELEMFAQRSSAARRFATEFKTRAAARREAKKAKAGEH